MLKRNIVANYVGGVWTALMAVAFVPMYIKYLGDEAFGVIGISVTIQTFLAFFDIGLTPMLTREMSRFTGGAHAAEAIRSLMRTVEVVAWCIGALAMGAIWLSAHWLATEWLRSDNLAPADIAHALRIMAFVVGMRFIEGLYRGCLIGLQRQVATNVIAATGATVRSVGSVAILALYSPTLDAYFWWQGAVALVSALTFVVCTYLVLPTSRVSWALGTRTLRAAWPFAGGMLLSSFLVLGLNNTDKLLLSRILDLADYGRYTVAVVAASCVSLSAGPISQAMYPRLTELHAQGQNDAFTKAFHSAAQMVTVVSGAVGATLIFFAEPIMLLWTHNPELAEATTWPIRLLAIGCLLNSLMTAPYLCQLATGWTSISNAVNAVAIMIVIPTLILVVPHYGMTGAAAVWAGLNALYITLGAPLSFRRLLPTEMGHWYMRDIAIPLVAAFAACGAVALAGQAIRPTGWMWGMLIVAGAGTATSAAVLAAPLPRAAAMRLAGRAKHRFRTGAATPPID